MTIYLDYQATTPLALEAYAAMQPWLSDGFANPHSSHKLGRAAAAAVEVARDQVAALLPSGGRVYFTSGATEAINWAMRGSLAPGVAISLPNSEHAAVRDTALWLGERGHPVTILPIGDDGVVTAGEPRAGLSAVMLVNNEIGVIQPVADLAAAAHRAGGLFLCDAVQAYGRIAIPDGPDMIAISAHKIHGPKGIGALWVRDGITLEPLLHGGGQEGGLRSGTLSPALCAGFGAAAAVAADRFDADGAHVIALAAIARERLPKGWLINGSTTHRYPGNLNIRLAGLDSARLISEVRGVALSSGSACASGSGRSSHVLRAIGLSEAEARSSLRLGFGRYTSEAELIKALDLIFAAAKSQSA
ncbi:MAG: cysteine desulfurase family protein [Sphingomonadaceae bacterium]